MDFDPPDRQCHKRLGAVAHLNYKEAIYGTYCKRNHHSLILDVNGNVYVNSRALAQVARAQAVFKLYMDYKKLEQKVRETSMPISVFSSVFLGIPSLCGNIATAFSFCSRRYVCRNSRIRSSKHKS